MHHTELIAYSKILTIAVAETNAGNKVHTVGIVDDFSNDENDVFQFKGSYEDQELSKYKSIRVKLHAPTPFEVFHCCVSSCFCCAPS